MSISLDDAPATPLEASLPVSAPRNEAVAIDGLPRSARTDADTYAGRVRAIIEALAGVENTWSDLRRWTTVQDVRRLQDIAKVICAAQADELVVRFYEVVLETRRAQPERVRAYFESLPEHWYTESPLYYTYPHSVGVTDGRARGTLDDLRQHLPYLRSLGFRNVQVLPHWRSAGGDGGYDVSGFVVDPELGGEEAFRRLMRDAMALGIRVITDFIPNHISTRHPWFEALLAGDERRLSWFLPMDSVTLVGHEVDGKGKTRALLRHENGELSKPWCIFPHASKRNLIDITVNGKKHQLFHSFYPFQVDLNLRNPEVLGELFKVLGWEANLGVAGKRMDAAPHYFKEDGTSYENLPGTHALLEVFKLFWRHVVSNGITVPEVGEGLHEAVQYFGARTEIVGAPSNAEGDAMFGFEWNSTMWAVLLDENAELFWAFLRKLGELPQDTYWFNLTRHHDELRTDLIPEGVRQRVEAKMVERGAQVFAGRGVGGRMADFLENDPWQIAKLFWLSFLPPKGTPVIYYGDEVGARNQLGFMRDEQARRLPILRELGFPADDANVALDTRDVGRGPVSAAMFASALNSGYLPLRTLRALNALWATRASLRAGNVFEVATGTDKVLAVGKWAKGEDEPLFAVGNLTGETVTIRVSASELREKLRHGAGGAFVLADVLGRHRDGVAKKLLVFDDETSVELVLAPHAHFVFEASNAG